HRNKNIHRKKSISALKQMERTEKKERTQCPRENPFSNRTIALISDTTVTTRPNQKRLSATPPATAPKPVAFCSVIPLKAFRIPGTNGNQASKMPQRDSFFFRSFID